MAKFRSPVLRELGTSPSGPATLPPDLRKVLELRTADVDSGSLCPRWRVQEIFHCLDTGRALTLLPISSAPFTGKINGSQPNLVSSVTYWNLRLTSAKATDHA